MIKALDGAPMTYRQFELEGSMQRNALKYLVDALLFVDICSVAVVGILLGFVIPRGQHTDKFFLGLHRHQWSDIHLYLSIFLMLLVIAHVWLNRKWVVQLSRRLFEDRWRMILYLLAVSWIFVLFVGWVIARC